MHPKNTKTPITLGVMGFVYLNAALLAKITVKY